MNINTRGTTIAVSTTALIASLFVFACNRTGESGQSVDDSPKAAADEAESGAEKPAASNESASAPEPSDESTSRPGPGEATATYHQMDGREPLPLTPMMANHQRQNMRDHLVAIRQIVGAAAQKDFDGIEKAAQKIGSSPQMKKMCNHMGAGADGFTERALEFHETADGIIEAADEEDYRGAMNALDETLGTCTSCHARYKQKIVPPDVWSQKTGMGAPSGGRQQMHHGGGHR